MLQLVGVIAPPPVGRGGLVADVCADDAGDARFPHDGRFRRGGGGGGSVANVLSFSGMASSTPCAACAAEALPLPALLWPHERRRFPHEERTVSAREMCGSCADDATFSPTARLSRGNPRDHELGRRRLICCGCCGGCCGCGCGRPIGQSSAASASATFDESHSCEVRTA